jgi:hypothetical protein
MYVISDDLTSVMRWCKQQPDVSNVPMPMTTLLKQASQAWAWAVARVQRTSATAKVY